VRLLTAPGVHRPIGDTWMLAAALRAQGLPPGAALLDLCTGTGALAVWAALRLGAEATAVDVSRRAVVLARTNARLNGVRIQALRGDLFAAVGARRFDAVVANPPYVPAAEDTDELPTRGLRRAWDAGRDGRVVLDRICAQAPRHLRGGGVVLLVHSSVNGVQATVDRLAAGGLDAHVVARHPGPLGPLMTSRAAALEARGLLRPGQRDEDVVVVRGRRSP
jgi:release factor glutamine methyltransferase